MRATIIKPTIPFLLALMDMGTSYGTTSATLEVAVRQEQLPTSFSEALPACIPEAQEQAAAASLAWVALTSAVLKDSRPMNDWERKVAADIFWSEFN